MCPLADNCHKEQGRSISMDLEFLLDSLARAEYHVTQGAAHVLKQKQVVADLAREGRLAAAQSAMEFLATLEATQAANVADRDRLKQELERLR